MPNKRLQLQARNDVFNKLKSKYDLLKLTKNEAKQIPEDKGKEYCLRLIENKYGKCVNSNCRECLFNVAFANNDEDIIVSDEELQEIVFKK